MAHCVIISNVLLGCACHCIMVLIDTHRVEHCFLSVEDLKYLLVRGIDVKHLQRVEPVRGVKISLSLSYLPLGACTGREVADPEVIRVVSVREQVVVLSRP
jgi:hypothetical protein